jgi:nucleotide-binding universal stress UspA family protein
VPERDLRPWSAPGCRGTVTIGSAILRPRRGKDGAMRSLITVGLSDGPASRAALRWALRRAARDDAVVLLLHVVPVGAHPSAVAAAILLLRRTVDDASGHAPFVTVSSRVLRGRVVPELISASMTAGMLIVGGQGGIADEPDVPRISRAIAADAACPVVVVPDADRLFAHGVALGVEDSASGRAAGVFASEEAASLGQRLTLVRAWQGSAKREADHLLERARDDAAQLHPEIAIDVRSIHGPVADVLVRSSAHAQLLVLGGTRSAPGARPALGAVGSAALRHLRAPTAFVPTAHAALLEDPRWEDAMWEGWADRLTGAPGVGGRTG